MNIGKKQRLSLFLATLSTTSASLASTCNVGYYDPNNGSNCIPAPAGSFVATTGATAATQAPVGYYVPSSGSSGAIPAPLGSFVSSTGMTSATLSPVGYYVPTTGASSAIAVQSGFYAPVSGLANQIPAGGMAAPLIVATQDQKILTQMSMNLFDSKDDNPLKLALIHQRGKSEQAGLESGDLKSTTSGMALEASLINNSETQFGIHASYAHHNLNHQNVDNKGDSYQLGPFVTSKIGETHLKTLFVYGQSSSDNVRLVSAKYSATNIETLRSHNKTSWLGFNTKFNHPITQIISITGELGAFSFKSPSINESGTAQVGSSSVTPLTTLNSEKLTYTSIPTLLGVNYEVLPASMGHDLPPMVITLGIVSNLNKTQNMHVSSVVTNSYQFDLPVKQTSTTSGLIKIKFNELYIAKDLNISGLLQSHFGSRSNDYQASLMLVKNW